MAEKRETIKRRIDVVLVCASNPEYFYTIDELKDILNCNRGNIECAIVTLYKLGVLEKNDDCRRTVRKTSGYRMNKDYKLGDTYAGKEA